MEQASKQQRDVFTDHPIITYTNRIQHEMAIITGMLASNHIAHSEKARAIRMLIENLPPSAKKDLEKEYQILVDYSKNEQLGSNIDPYAIYGDVSNWIYSNILQDVFRAIPLYRGEGTLTSSTRRVSDKPGLGVDPNA